MQPLLLLLLVAGAAKANHQMRLTDEQIAVAQANYESMSTEFKAELAATAASSRASLKKMFVEEVMERNAGRKRSVVELEAEEWLETIQQAKREVHKSMGIGNIEPIDDGLWQTDIILRQHEAEEIILRHGGELPAHRKAARAKRSVLFFDGDSTKRWVSPITYTFDSSIPDQATRDRIKANIAKVTQAAPCLQFNYVANPTPNSYYMKFTNPKGAASLSKNSCGGSAFIGMYPPDAQDQTGIVGNSVNIQCLMTFGDQCFIDTMILHEIFHALGLGHEQCRGDREKWVNIDMNKVIPGMQNNYAIDSNASYTPYGMGYNYSSLMQYKPNTLGINNAQVMTAKMPPIAENTAKMGNNAPICGAIPTDWAQLNRAYCANPAKMTPVVQFAFSKMKCYGDKSSCTAGLSQVSDATCPSGYSPAIPSTGSCFPCTGSACFSAQPGDDWVATAYRASINAAGTYSGCGGPFFGMKAAKCTNPTVCGDSDAEFCGYGPLQGQKCTDSTFAKKCPKTCGIAPCPKV